MGVSKTTDIREAVEAELGFDPLIDDTNIAVMNLNGEVALNGTVPSYPQYLAAERAAKRVAGVRGVHNHLEVVLRPEDYRDDAMLTTAANNALTLDVTVPEGVEATAGNGNLTLTGSVSYGSQREAAERAVAALTGVRDLKDKIDVRYYLDPLDVNQLVLGALDRYPSFRGGGDVTVETAGNTVTLSGYVCTWAEHDAAVRAAWMAGGVVEVRDNIVVTG
jgi:osmotically-inducible protein OsmY